MKNIINESLSNNDGDELYFSIIRDIIDGVEAGKAINTNCNVVREKGNNFIADVYEVLMEASVQFMPAQAFVVAHLVDHPRVQLWGMKNVDGWKLMSIPEKSNRMFKHFLKTGALEEARNFMESTKDATSVVPNVTYDVHDVEEPYTGIKSTHWEQFKKSKVYDDLEKIFLKALEV